MAVNPNTQFSSGAVYTADEANRFPRGVMVPPGVTIRVVLNTNVLSESSARELIRVLAYPRFRLTRADSVSRPGPGG